MTTLYKHQSDWLRDNVSKPRAALWWQAGVGKSAVAARYLKYRGIEGLVICPKGLVLNWQKELLMWGAEAMVISKEEFKKYEGVHPYIIVDECDTFASAGFKSALSKALRSYIKKHDPHVLLCSATPYRSNPMNIFVLASFLGHAWNYKRFQETYFSMIWMGQRQIPVIRQDAAERLIGVIAQIGDVRTLDDCVDVPEQVDEVIDVGETKEQVREKRNLQDIVPIARFTAEHRIESLGNKIERVVRLCEEHPKIAIVGRYRFQLARYKEALKGVGKPVYEIHGDISTQEREEVVERVARKDACVILIQSATVEGYSLGSIPTMVFASCDWSYRNYIQCRGRIQRINSVKKNLYVHLVCGDADRAIMAAMARQSDFDVVKYMRERKADHGGGTKVRSR